jgi:hypothetical protein
VGSEEAKYVLHKNFVCSKSDFFRAAMEGEWKESKEKVVRLPNVQPATFTIYIGWIYAGILDLQSEPEPPQRSSASKVPNPEVANATFDTLVDAYALGEMVQDAGFRNGLVNELIKAVEGFSVIPSATTVSGMWIKVSEGSKLARLMVDYWCSCNYSKKPYRDSRAGLPSGFMAEMAAVSVEEIDTGRAKRRPINRPKCFYHDHKTDADKCE